MKRTYMRVWKLMTASAMVVSLFSGTTSITKAQTTADEIMEGMSLRQKIGQMIMPDFRQWMVDGKLQNVTVMNEDIRKIIRDYDFGGVILFANNVTQTEQTTRLTYDLQHTAIEDKNLPLLITIDQEGGNVVRLGTGTSLPGNMALGATRDPKAAYDAGDIIGSELHALGININFAPVVDINSNPSNPVIGERSIGSDPKLVAEIAVPLLKGMQANNTATAVKHFPGHGDTATDSHVGLPLVNKTYEELKNFELVPFQAAADAGTDMIMTAHIQVPKIETETAISKKDGKVINIPATLSKALITGVIREKMQYDGIVVTDALNMSAIADNFGEADAVLRTFKADVDIALMPTILRSPSDAAKLETIYQTVENAVASGELTMANIDNSVKRIIDLKIKRGIINVDQYTTSVDEEVANAKKIVGSSDHHAIERTISQKAITVVKNEDHLLPMKPKAGEKILLIGAYSNETPALQYGLTKLMSEGVVNAKVQYDTAYYTSAMKDLSSLQKKLDWADRIITITEISNASNLKMTSWLSNIPTQLCAYAKEADKPIVLVSIGKPYDAVAFPDAQAMVLAYASKGMDPTEPGQEPSNTYGPNIPAAMDIIFGKVPATGKLPVDVYALNEDRTYSNTIQMPFGYGFHDLTTITKTTAAIETKGTFKVGETIDAVITLQGVKSFINDGIKLNLRYDNVNFTLNDIQTSGAKQGSIINEGDNLGIRLSNAEQDTITITVKLNVNKTGEFTPLTVIGFNDTDDRDLFFETTNKATVNIPDHSDKEETQPDNSETEKESNAVTPPVKPSTGDDTNAVSIALLSLISLGVLVTIRKRKQ